MNTMTNEWDVVVALIYIVGVLCVVYLLKNPLSSLLTKNNVKVSIPGMGVVEISPSEAGGKISQLINEYVHRYDSLLNNFQKKLFRKIIENDSPVIVEVLIPNFDRSNDEHIGALRALKGLGLIESDDKKSWNKSSKVVLTSFGQALNEFLDKELWKNF